MKKREYKISEESAQFSLDELLDYYEIDFNDLPAAQQDQMGAVERKLIKWIREGRLEIKTEDGIQCIQTLRNAEQITYREIDGAAKTAMGTKTAEDQHGRVYAVMGALCGQGETLITKLKGPDLSLAECLGGLFLLV